jgi:hypothetical protein
MYAGSPERDHERVPGAWDLKFKQWEHPDWEVSATSESQSVALLNIYSYLQSIKFVILLLLLPALVLTPKSFGIGAACHLLPFSSISCPFITYIHLSHIIGYERDGCHSCSNLCSLILTSSSPSFHSHVLRSSSQMFFLCPHHKSIPAQISFKFFRNRCSF